jgi:hypothetical protein
MSVNVPVTPGSGKVVGADEVIDGVLGTVQIQYVKIMDGAANGTTKAAVGANGLKVDASGITLTVGGNVNASQSGTWIVQPGNTPNTVAWKVDGSAVTQPVSGTVAATESGIWSVRNQDGSGNLLTSATRGAQQALSVQIIDASGNQITSFGGAGGTSSSFGSAFPAAGTAIGVMNNAGTAMTNLSVNASGALKVDGSAVTQPVSGTFWQTTQPVSLASTTITGTVAVTQSGSWTVGQSGNWSVRMQDGAGNALTSVVRGVQQALSIQLIDGSGNQIGIGTAPLRVDPTGTTTQPVSGTVGATQSGNWTSRVVGNAGGIVDAAQNAAAPANEVVVGGVYNSSAPTITSGNASQLQLDASGNLNVNIKAGAGSGGTASTFGSSFPSTGTAIGAKDSGGTLMQPMNLDASGNLKVNVAAGGASGGTSSSFGAAIPGTGTAAGFSDGTNMQLGHVFDLDTGAGFEWNQGVVLRKAASGGSVVFGTSTDPIRIDPTGTTAQPVTGTFWQTTQPVSGTFWQTTQPISATSLPLPSGAATSAAQPSNSTIGATTSGQTGTMAFGAATTAAPSYTTAQSYPLSLTLAGALRTDSSATTQPVSGTFWQATQPVSGTVTVTQGTAANLNANVSGTVAATQSGTWNITNVSGTVSLPTGAATSANQPTAAAAASTTTGQTGNLAMGAVSTAAPAYTTATSNWLSLTTVGNLRVDGSSVTQPVSGTFWQATQPVSGTVAATQSGTWTVQPGNTANTTAWLVTGTGGTFPVTGTFWQATQPVSVAAAVTIQQSTAANLQAQVTPAAIGTWGLSPATQNTATPTNDVLVSGQFNTTPTAIASGNCSPLQLDTNGNLLVNIKAGGAAGGTSSSVGATTPGTGTLALGAVTTSFPAYTTGTANSLSLDTNGALRVNVLTSTATTVNQGTSPWLVSGNATAGASASGIGLTLVGGIVATANPTAGTAGNTVQPLFDKVGKQITAGAIRTLKGVQKTSITVATETTVVTAGAAGVFNDVYAIVVTNKSATAVFVDFRDSTAGTIRMTLAAPASDTRGFTVPVDSAIVQATAANNWTATVSSAVTSIEISMLYTSNV